MNKGTDSNGTYMRQLELGFKPHCRARQRVSKMENSAIPRNYIRHIDATYKKVRLNGSRKRLHFRKRLRTSNMSENLNIQINRRKRLVGPFSNEASLLRLVTGLIDGNIRRMGNWKNQHK